MLSFIWPWVWLLLPLPLLVYLLLPRVEPQQSALQLPFYSRLLGYAGHSRPGLSGGFWRRLLSLLIWLLLLLAASRPEWTGDPVEIPVSGRDISLAVDVSGSMSGKDMSINNRSVDRLQAVKHVVGDFVERRQGDRMSLILFGTRPYLIAPLTFDLKTVRILLEEASIAVAGKTTAIGDAIGLAVKRLQDRPISSRVLILLTDGANTDGEVDPVQAAGIAARAGIKIYTVGIGADEMTVRNFFSSRRINPSADLDEETLQEIAKRTGGRYFRAKNTRQLTEIYAELDQLEPIAEEQETFRPVLSLYYYPLGLALLLSFLLPLFAAAARSRLVRLLLFRRQRTAEGVSWSS